MKNILVTGGAGFIGFHMVKKLLENNYQVISVDNLNSYYSPKLKRDRLSYLVENFSRGYEFIEIDIVLEDFLSTFLSKKIDIIIHLAAQAGVRNSIDDPKPYIFNNIIGHFNVLELARLKNVNHLLSASTSSVFGGEKRLPFNEKSNADLPIQLYAATKRSNEIVSYSYSAMYHVPITMMRFFTVYGTWGRPDMSLFKFVKNIIDGKSVDVYNFGNHSRSFTSVTDVCEVMLRLMEKPPGVIFDKSGIEQLEVPYRELNVGNRKKETIKDFINVIERTLNKRAQINLLPLQRGDVRDSICNPDVVEALINYEMVKSIYTEIPEFIRWYKDYYGIK